ncbi:serine/threonine protein kinase [Corallococcus macrosporus]|uniref:Serine/threonine protein kinase n=1 Tax=Corallococcus macrosporus DSM 14697 TaxID=1189310 RepID=A0A250K5L3_9BACT|nr:serine/threonine-protein kinase [Corallococcus macrosporus]ATB50982.1 serine/threonine protein kinase [Corallococcus macrosporus DSM 14697]
MMARRLRGDVAIGTQVGGFVVEALLGMGGCGAVFRARRGDARFALKLQSLAALGGWAHREVDILRRLDHPNVVRFHACGLWRDTAPEWFYLAMELVEGRPLNQWVDEENPSPRQAAALALGLARGLAAAHAAGVLHRDLKESNIMVRDATGAPVLVDFGVGSYPGAPRLTWGVLPPGTPQYRSPEALAFRKSHADVEGAHYAPTAADDLYALGVVLYWVLTGHAPFPAPGTPSEVEHVISQPPEAPRAVNPRVPDALDAVCSRLLEKQPTARFPSAAALAEALELALAAADGEWDRPLCASWEEAPAPAVPPPPQGGLEAWLHQGEPALSPPRRGRRPGRARPSAGGGRASPGDAREEVAPRPGGARISLRTPRGWRPAALALTVGLLTALTLAWALTRREGARPVGRERPEMASTHASPEAVRAAAPPTSAAHLPATAAAPMARAPKEASPVKKPDLAPSSPPPSQPSRSVGSLARRAAITAATCTALACQSGPEVRPAPPSEPCPEGAVQAMEARGLRIGELGSVHFARGEPKNVTVREGWVRLRVGATPYPLAGATLSGRLIVSERVYGRFTEAEMNGERFPVCIELLYPGDDLRGHPRVAGNHFPAEPIIRSASGLRLVRRFE